MSLHEATPSLEPAVFLGAEPVRVGQWLCVNGDANWRVNSSSFNDYSRRADIHGHPDGLTDIVFSQVGLDPNNVGLDIAAGSSARALRDLLDRGVLGRALATNYQNRRPSKVANDPRLDHITGDITKPSVLEGVASWTHANAPEGLALVMHRPIGALQDLPPRTYKGAAHFLLDLVRPEGIMFTQVPRSLRKRGALGAMRSICASIIERPDVAKVMATPPRNRPKNDVLRNDLDENDVYAVIIKS